MEQGNNVLKSVCRNPFDSLDNGLKWGETRGGKNNLEVRTRARAAGNRGMEVSTGMGGKEFQDLLLIFVRWGRIFLESCICLIHRMLTYI